METKTRTEPTMFGDVDFETAECASCKMEYATSDMVQFFAGEVHDESTFLGSPRVRFSSRNYYSGYLCERCATDQHPPNGFLTQGHHAVIAARWMLAEDDFIAAMQLCMGAMLLSMMLVFGMVLASALVGVFI